MQRKAVLAVAAALAATAALLPSGPALAADPPTGESQLLPIGNVPVRAAPASAGTFLVIGSSQLASTLSDEAMQDLVTYAEQSGEDLSALVESHQGIDEFSEFATRLEQTRPDLFVRAGLATTDGAAHYWIQLTAKPAAGLVADLARLPVNTEVQYGAPASSKELADLADSLTASLAARSDVIRSTMTSYDHEEHVLRVQYAPVAGARLATVGSAFQEALTASTVRGELPIEVLPELNADLAPVMEKAVQGGRDLDLASNSAAECTARFTARRSNRGVLTARHCANALIYGNTPGVLGLNPVVATGATDLQFHRTRTGNGHTTYKQFRATGRSENDDRTVTSVANAPIGSVVCHWGRTTGYSCDRVDEATGCYDPINGPRACGVASTVRHISAGGDSGGPWFFGNTARGIHSGGGGERGSLFTRIGRVQAIDATVLQN